MFGDDNYHHEVNTVIKESGEIFSDKFKMHFFELRKVGKKPDPKNKRELWLQFINADSEEDFDMISQTNDPEIRRAVKVIFDMSEDTRIREIARAREKMMHDEASALKGARAEGRTEERALIKSRMQSIGMSDEDIRRILGE